MGTARTRRPKDLRAGTFQPAINSFTFHLNAEGKSPKTVRTYAEAAQWFAAEHLRRNTDHTDWDDVTPDDVRAWTVWLLNTYSDMCFPS
jgi:integrase/recombinase XerD